MLHVSNYPRHHHPHTKKTTLKENKRALLGAEKRLLSEKANCHLLCIWQARIGTENRSSSLRAEPTVTTPFDSVFGSLHCRSTLNSALLLLPRPLLRRRIFNRGKVYALNEWMCQLYLHFNAR